MASGAGKYLESLEPVAYYTFDTPDTMEVDGVYYFFNGTAYDFPFLNPRSTSVYNDKDYTDPTSYSLSIAEKSERYRSFIAGKSYRRSYKEVYYEYNYEDRVYERKYRDGWFNSHSKPILYDDFDNSVIDLFEDGQYSIMMQLKIQDVGGVNSFGMLLQEELLPQFDEVTGLEVPPVDMNGKPIDVSATRIFTKPSSNVVLSNIYYDVESFRFMDIGFVVENINSTVYLNFYNQAYNSTLYQSPLLSIPVTLDTLYSLAFMVDFDKDANRVNVKVYMENKEQESTYTIYYPLPDIKRHALKMGFISHALEETITPNEAKSYGYLEDKIARLRPIYATRYITQFDNFAIFNRQLTLDEIRRYNALNYDMKSLYVRFGFTELYDFNQWFDSDSTNHIQDDNTLTSIILTNANRSLRPRSDEPYTGLTVKRYIEGNIEYSLDFSKKSMLYDMPFFYYYSDQYRFIKDENFTVSFFFKTTDMNGLLMAYARSKNSSKNLMLYFKEGSLQIWLDQDIKKELNGYNNGEFHHLVITNNTTYGLIIYINGILIYNHKTNLYESASQKYCVFGNGLPYMVGLKFELALLAYAPRYVSILAIKDINHNTLIYEATGIITLNNIRVGTTVLIYDHYSGKLLERVKSSDIDGVFRYTNRYPYTITVVVNDDAMLNGRSYIVSPVEIK